MVYTVAEYDRLVSGTAVDGMGLALLFGATGQRL